MSPSKYTRRVGFTVLQRSATQPAMYLDVPVATKITSIEEASQWRAKLQIPCAVRAFISIELLEFRLTDMARRIIDQYDQVPELLLGVVNDATINLVNELVDWRAAECSESEVLSLELQILNIEARIDTTPGLYVEISHGHDVLSDITWWGNELPGYVVGHISIQTYSGATLPRMKVLLESMIRGEPEGVETILQNSTLQVANHLLTTT